MVSIGVDAHKKVLVAVALDESGRVAGRWEGGNGQRDWARFLAWSNSLGSDITVGIEGAYSYGRGLGQWLCARAVRVYDINPRWTAAFRRTARRQHKSDAFDAEAVARIVQRDGADLPEVFADDVSSTIDLLVGERDAALAESVRLRNQLHAHLFHLDIQVKTLESEAALERVLGSLPDSPEGHAKVRVHAVRLLVERCRLALAQVKSLTAEIEGLADAHYAPLTRIYGVGKLLAGTIGGILGPSGRFTSEAQLAAYAGAAPLEASSAGKTRHRLNRTGCRKLNAVLHMIALSQIRSRSSPGHVYLQRRRTEGKTFREALRALKRYLARAVFALWRECFPRQAALVQQRC